MSADGDDLPVAIVPPFDDESSNDPDTDLIAHSRTDLELTLAVIDAAKNLRHLAYADSHANDCPAQDSVYGACDCGRDRLLFALHDWDAAP